MENAQLNGHELRYALTPGDYQAIRGRLRERRRRREAEAGFTPWALPAT